LLQLPVLFCEAVCRKREIGVAEVDRILVALSETHWNKSQAAEKLHWSRMTLYRKMSRYRISDPEKAPLRRAAS
jgi:transcriptional regulator of acetoin/glycerol metabolism